MSFSPQPVAIPNYPGFSRRKGINIFKKNMEKKQANRG
jgi:hypothetical protein